MCLYLSNAIFGGTMFFIRGTYIRYIYGWDYIWRGFFQGIYSMLIIKLVYFHGLRKTFFLFSINIVELNYIQSLTPWFRIQKKLAFQAKITIRDIVFFPGFKFIIIDVTLLNCNV